MRCARAAGVPGLLQLGVMSASLLVPAAASAQSAECEIARVGGFTYRARFDSVSFVYHASGGVDYRCSDGTRILADSAVVFESNEQVQLFGRVHIEDADMELDADTAFYFGGLQQLNAWSNVTVTDRQSGAIITGHRVSLDRATEVRPTDRMVVYDGSPHATVFPVVRPVAADTVAADRVEVADSAEVADSVTAGDGIQAADSAQAGDSVGVSDSAQAEDLVRAEDPAQTPDSISAGDSAAVYDAEPPLDTSTAEAEPPAPTVSAGPREESVEAAEGAVVAEDTAGRAADGDAGDGATEAEPIRLSPYEIDADRFVLEGRYFRATGDVVVVRDSLRAEGDSLDYDQEVGAMSIFGDARVEGQSYELTASTISVTPTSGLREELLARRDATLSGQDVDMVAPAIRMFLESGMVNRLVAIGEIPPLPGEPRTIDTEGLSAGDAARVLALAEQAVEAADSAAVPDSLFRPSVRADQFSLTGDSIDVLSPGQVLDLVTAVGTARAEGLADDTLAAAELPEVARRDWMEGDTVIADFSTGEPADSVPADSIPADSAPADSVPADSAHTQNTENTENTDASAAPDSAQRSRLESITAVGSARSLYRMIDSDTAQAEPETLAADPEPVGADPTDPGAAPMAADPGSELTAAGPAPADTATSPVVSDEPARPALHWVEGEKIIVYLEGREVVSMDVEGQTVGYHLEPRPPGAPADSATAADSAALAADSAAGTTTAATDSATTVPDTATADPDIATTDPDTTNADPDTTTADPDTATTGRGGSAVRSATVMAGFGATADRAPRGAGDTLPRPRPRRIRNTRRRTQSEKERHK